MGIKTSTIQYYSSVSPQAVDWLWYPYIPYGRITVIQGDPGERKTTFVLQLPRNYRQGSLCLNVMKQCRPITSFTKAQKMESRIR